MPHEHGRESLLLRAQRHANSDFAGALGNGISDYSIDPYDSEQQRHAACHAQHNEGEGSARHRFLVEVSERVNFSERNIGINRPHRLADFFQERFGTGARAANGKSDTAAQAFFLTFKAVHNHGPVNGGGWILINAVVVRIGNDSDDFAPVVVVADANSLSQRVARVMPILARKIFGDDRDRNSLVDIVPGEIAAGDERSTQRRERSPAR